VIVGAGPAGLATAIAAQEAGLDYEVIEKDALVNSIFHFPRNQIFFTTPELLEIGGLPFVTPYEKPTRIEALRYYRRVVERYDLRLRLGEELLAIRSEAERQSFALTTRKAGSTAERRARAVAVACGYYDHPNRLGIPGEDLPHVSHYYVEAHPFFRKRVVIVGGKNSAALAALDLFRSGAQVTLVHRRAELGDSIKYWIRPDIDNRIQQGSIAARFGTRVVEIRPECVVVEADGRRDEIAADAVFLLTGYHPDRELLAGAGVRVDPETLVPDHDPETLETNVPGLFVAGAMVSGRQTSRIFIENGRFHGEAIARAVQARLRR